MLLYQIFMLDIIVLLGSSCLALFTIVVYLLCRKGTLQEAEKGKGTLIKVIKNQFLPSVSISDL